MRLLYYRGEKHTNFGDELNPLFWERFLGDSKKSVCLLGIGTVLNEHYVRAANGEKVIVFGSGCGFFPPPDFTQQLDVMFVRGPKSAQLLRRRWGFDVDWITDPGLLAARFQVGAKKDIEKSFVPHWSTIADQPGIVSAFADIGVTVIDPRQSVKSALEMIERSKLVIAEAMHGAIVADAFRIPWIPVYAQHGHLFKWLDWCDSMLVPYDPQFFETSSMNEIAKYATPTLSRDWVHQERLGRLEERLYDLKAKL
jgi:succinoglycan biosynthesis protein ExoV